MRRYLAFTMLLLSFGFVHSCKSQKKRAQTKEEVDRRPVSEDAFPRVYKVNPKYQDLLNEVLTSFGDVKVTTDSRYPTNASLLKISNFKINATNVEGYVAADFEVEGSELTQFYKWQACSQEQPDVCESGQFAYGSDFTTKIPEGVVRITAQACVEEQNALTSESCGEVFETIFYQEVNEQNDVAKSLGEATAAEEKIALLCQQAQEVTTEHSTKEVEGQQCSDQMKAIMQSFRQSGGQHCAEIAEIGLLDELNDALDEEFSEESQGNNKGKALLIAGVTSAGLGVLALLYARNDQRRFVIESEDVARYLNSIDSDNSKNAIQHRKKFHTALEKYKKAKIFSEEWKINRRLFKAERTNFFNQLNQLERLKGIPPVIPPSLDSFKQKLNAPDNPFYRSRFARFRALGWGLMIGGFAALVIGANQLSYSLTGEAHALGNPCDQSYQDALQPIAEQISDQVAKSRAAKLKVLDESELLPGE